MTRAWDMHRCTIKPANLLPFVDKVIQVKQIYVSGTKETGYVGTNEIINATVKKYEESQNKTWPDYVELEYTRADGTLHTSHSPTNIFIQYGDNAFANLATTGALYINEIIDKLKKWDNTELSLENIKILGSGF